jgi:prepilin-type N-terminal cleavage/methylation domain-containing protein
VSAESQPQTNRELSRGFTLLEVLLVLGLISMLAAVLIGGSASLLKGTARDDPEDAMLALLQTVRREAVEKNQALTLKSVDNALEDIATYTWGENRSETLPTNENVKVKLVAPEVAAAILIGGQAEEKALSKVRFFPDGTCDRVRLEVSRSGERRIIPIDPLTCAPLPSENAK